MEMNQDYRYAKARHRARAIRNFYIALMVYCVVLPSMITVNYVFSPGFTWWWYSAGGMLIGIIIHGISAFSAIPFLGKDWEGRKIRELMERATDRNSGRPSKNSKLKTHNP